MSWALLFALSSTSQTLMSVIFLLALVVLPILVLVSLSAFGGVRRNALAHFSIGLLLLVASNLILAAWAASEARVGDTFIGVAVTVCPLPWLGSTLLLWSLGGFGINRGLIAALWIVNLVALFFLEFVYLGPAPYGGAPFILYAIVMASVVVLLLLLHQRWGALLKGLLLGLGSAAIVLVVYGFGRQEILLTPNPFDPPQDSLGTSIGLTLLLGVVLFFVARFGSFPAPVNAAGSASWPTEPAEPAHSIKAGASTSGGRAARSWMIGAAGMLGLLLIVALVLSDLAAVSPLAGFGPTATPAAQVDQLTEPAPGLGKFLFILTPDHTVISELTITFVDFSCGSESANGNSLDIRGGFHPIYQGQFTFVTPFGSASPSGPENMLTIKGSFDRTGRDASGTWTAQTEGGACTGQWGPQATS